MILHSSKPMEKFAMRAHACWASVSLVSALLCLGAAYFIFPLAGVSTGPIGVYFQCMFYLFLAQFIFGIGGCVFHVYGALDHRANLAQLAARKRKR